MARGYQPRSSRGTRLAVGAASVLLGAISVTGLATSVACTETSNPPAVMRERLPPESVAPVVHGGIRYEIIHWGKARGLGQNGGYVAAVDQATKKELWLVKVYSVDYGTDMEADRQDVFITEAALEDGGRRLLVEDERGRRFAIDLATRAVSAIASPAAK